MPSRTGVLYVGFAALFGFGVMVLAAWSVDVSPFDVTSYGRWDTGQYINIAEDGYRLSRCETRTPNRSPDDWCGNAGWMPMYPLMMRGIGALGVDLDQAGLVIAFTATVASLWVLWQCFLRHDGSLRSLSLLMLVIVFPGAPWLWAISPMSTLVLVSLLTAHLLARDRPMAAGVCASIAVMLHSLGLVVVVVAVIYQLVAHRADLRSAVLRALAAGAPAAAALALWLAHLQAVTGRWNAYLLVQSSYHHDTALPPFTLNRRLRGLLREQFIDDYVTTVRLQEVLLTVIVASALVVAFRCRRRMVPQDWAALSIGAGIWVVELQGGTTPSFWRLALYVSPIVVVLRHAPAAVMVVLAMLLVPVEYVIAQGFFDATLY